MPQKKRKQLKEMNKKDIKTLYRRHDPKIKKTLNARKTSEKVEPACWVTTPCDQHVLFARPFERERRSLAPKKGRRNLSLSRQCTFLGLHAP